MFHESISNFKKLVESGIIANNIKKSLECKLGYPLPYKFNVSINDDCKYIRDVQLNIVSNYFNTTPTLFKRIYVKKWTSFFELKENCFVKFSLRYHYECFDGTLGNIVFSSFSLDKQGNVVNLSIDGMIN